MSRAVAAAALLGVLGCAPLTAQEPGCEAGGVRVPGMVETRRGDPLPDATVLVPELQLRLVTDARGHFILPDVCPGSYRIRVSHLGFAPVDRTVEVGSGTRIELALRNQAVELEGMLVEVAPVMVRLEERRRSYGGRSAVFDWRDFDPGSVPADIPEWVARRAGVQVVACGDAFWGTRNCFRDRREVRRVEVCVDETNSVGGPTTISRFPREEIGRAEFYRREGLMKIYTKDFLARAALTPSYIQASATAC